MWFFNDCFQLWLIGALLVVAYFLALDIFRRCTLSWWFTLFVAIFWVFIFVTWFGGALHERWMWFRYRRYLRSKDRH